MESLVTGRGGGAEDVVLVPGHEVAGGEAVELRVSAVEPGQLGCIHGAGVLAVAAQQTAGPGQRSVRAEGGGSGAVLQQDGGQVGAGHEVTGGVDREVLPGIVRSQEVYQDILVNIMVSKVGLVDPLESIRQSAGYT